MGAVEFHPKLRRRASPCRSIRSPAWQLVMRSINHQLKIEDFPIHHDLSHFDFTQGIVDEALIRQQSSAERTPFVGSHST